MSKKLVSSRGFEIISSLRCTPLVILFRRFFGVRMICLYNTLTRTKEQFQSAHATVALYACGPTVYDFAHIGHFRAYIFVDVLRRILRYNGYKVTHVMNITDVGHLTDDADSGEDKIERKAAVEKKSVWDIAKFYTDDFFTCIDALNIERPEIVCKATDHIKEMIEVIQKIEKAGFAYHTSDGVYFDTGNLSDYGKLAQLDIAHLKEGARVLKSEKKRQHTDFALWKFSSPGIKRQMEWDSPFGVGFPGWHIECTAMGAKYLGENIDIHTGGIDHIPVHHTNEIAQSQAAFGKEIVRFWLHNEFMLVDGEKMSKSKRNFYRLEDCRAQGITPLALRYFFLQAHYRSPVNFTWEALYSAQSGLSNLYKRILEGTSHATRLEPDNAVMDYQKAFHDAVNDDLNTAKGLSVMWDMLKDESIAHEQKTAMSLDFDRVLGLGFQDVLAQGVSPLPPEIKKLAKEREEARWAKDYARSDKLRKRIEEAGYEVQDTSQDTKIVTSPRKSLE